MYYLFYISKINHEAISILSSIEIYLYKKTYMLLFYIRKVYRVDISNMCSIVI